MSVPKITRPATRRPASYGRFGRYLMRKKFERYNPVPYEIACEMERRLAERLRRRGFAVWQN